MNKRTLVRIKNFIWDTVAEGKNPSSKRVAGCLGWLLCLGASVVAMIKEIPSPEIIEILFWTSCALLGIDSIASAFNNKHKE